MSKISKISDISERK